MIAKPADPSDEELTVEDAKVILAPQTFAGHNGNGQHRSPPPQTGRVLPHSLEAEEYLLSTILLDGEAMLLKCIEAKIRPESFYDPKHEAIFSELLRMRTAGKPIDTPTLAEELRDSGRLEGLGGYAFIAQVSSRIPTTAQSSFFLSRVRDLAIQRELIRVTSSTIEDAFELKAGIASFAAESVERMKRVADQATTTDSIIDRIEASRYDPKRRLPEVAPVYLLGKTPIFTRGNIATITAQSKTGKSSFSTGVLASTFLDPNHGGDCFTVASENPSALALIHYDTEQHGKHHERMLDAVMRRSGAVLMPDWFCSYSRKGASAAQLREELEAICKVKAKRHDGIHSILLDGVADFVTDVNDAKECNTVVSWMESLSVKYDCPIICVLHLNPISGRDSVQKSRGHLGSQLLRKCETDIRLHKDESDVTTVYTHPDGTRGQPVFEKDGPRFKWSHDDHMHMSCGKVEAPRDTAKREKLSDLLEASIQQAGKERMRYGELLKAIADAAGVGISRAEARYAEMKAAGLISKDLLGFWGPTSAKG